ncbi:hypothetical protein BJ912DRAFT_1058477 [Pholiota molesta]|nr:hypothetical protein BJ912DRAFT_1058477 [Pholiota molesta]
MIWVPTSCWKSFGRRELIGSSSSLLIVPRIEELCAFEPQDPGEVDKAEGGVELGSAVGRSPIELIISIFEFLHPIDLYHAIQTTKGLRSFLRNKNSTTLWKESFLNHPDIPFYPPGVSAPKWASLLFGPATCDTCGIETALLTTLFARGNDDYYCDDEELLAAIQPIIGEFHDQLENLWSVGKKIYYFSPFLYGIEEHVHAGYEPDPRYFLEDVTERAREMREYLLDIRSGAPDAQTKYQTFLRITGAAVQEHMEQARRCELWAANIYADCEATFIASVFDFCEKNEKALLSRGYDSRDVEQAQNMFKWKLDQFRYSDSSDPVFSKSRIRKYLPELEVILQESITSRLAEEHAQRVNARQARICTLYFKTTKEILTQDKAPYLPHPQKLYTHQVFADYINDPKDSVDELDASAQQEVLSFIDTLWTAKKRRLLAVLLETGLLPEEATEDSNPDDYLGLAIAVFECCHTAFVGWEDAGTHVQCLPSPRNTNAVGDVVSAESFRFSDTGFQALRNLAGLLRLDLRFMLAEDLDTLNKRFFCKTCKFHRQAGLYGLHAMTWRECLTHATKMLSDSSEAERHVVFDILSEALMTSVLAVEKPFLPSAVTADWACKHCNVWFEPVKRAEAVAHIKQATASQRLKA